MALLAVAKRNAAEQLSFSVKGIKASIQGYNLLVTVNVLALNPTDKTFSVSSLSGELFLNNDPIGEVSSYQNKIIQANTETTYPVNLFLPFDNVTSKIFDLINNFSGIDVRLSGTANVDGVEVPANIYYKVA